MSEKKPKKVFVEGAISPQFVADSIAKHSTKMDIGAHSIFLGQVRADAKADKRVVAIDYSCYEEMANETFHLIREAAFEKFSLTCMHIYHSLGRVEAGDISLFVFTSSIHRKDAIEACEWLVERIKKEVPVWGLEIMQDNSYFWKQNT